MANVRDIVTGRFHGDGPTTPWPDIVAEKIKRRLCDQDVEYFVAEIEHWKQRCEELELELLMLENSYERTSARAEAETIKPKNRGLF
jgi:hypothetical protein